jgi:hypothetical protein
MNDRIEELIVSYLHRGSTPEQERELFDACKNNPDVATMLRQHITLSLKLRMLRDKTEVPQETHNALMRRINELKVDPAPVRASRWAWLPSGVAAPRPAWRIASGTALVTVTAMVALFFLIHPFDGDNGGSAGTASITPRTETVIQTRIDTVYQTRTVSKPVYIVRYEHAKVDPENVAGRPTPLPPSTDLAQQENTSQETTPNTKVNSQTKKPVIEPTIADARVPEAPSYLQQYTSMVSSLEKIRLSSTDRVRE